jgi:uncharacterized membrane protein (UPF0127 family)
VPSPPVQLARPTPAAWTLVDVESGRAIASQVARADTVLSRFIGLLGRRSLAVDEGLWLEPCDSIHMFFMRFPIDAVFVDRGGVVIACVERLRPWRVTRLYSKARACVELAAGVIQSTGVRVGARLALTTGRPEGASAL